MDQENNNQQGYNNNGAETFGNVRNVSENFGRLPNPSEDFRNLPNASEDNRKWRWTLTVKEVVRQFEDAAVPRSDHTITNWCQPDQKTGTSRLDARYDERERKWFIDPNSVRRVLGEEQDRQRMNNPSPVRNLPKLSEEPDDDVIRMRASDGKELEKARKRIEELEAEVRDKEIANRVKDQFIKKMETDQERLFRQNEMVHAALNASNHRSGYLEGQLHQLGAPMAHDESRAITPLSAEEAGDTAGDIPEHRQSESNETHYSPVFESPSHDEARGDVNY
jgi:hypothetical protein